MALGMSTKSSGAVSWLFVSSERTHTDVAAPCRAWCCIPEVDRMDLVLNRRWRRTEWWSSCLGRPWPVSLRYRSNRRYQARLRCRNHRNHRMEALQVSCPQMATPIHAAFQMKRHWHSDLVASPVGIRSRRVQQQFPPAWGQHPHWPVLRRFNVSTCLVSVTTLSPTVSPWELCCADGRSKKLQLFLVPGFRFSRLDIGIGDGEMLFRSQIRGILIHKQKGAALFEVTLRHASCWGNTWIAGMWQHFGLRSPHLTSPKHLELYETAELLLHCHLVSSNHEIHNVAVEFGKHVVAYSVVTR